MKKPSRLPKSKIILLAASLLFFIILTALVGRPLVQSVSEPEQFKAWVSDKGMVGMLAFIGMNIVQVLLAVIPGGPFEMAAGYAFGTWKGAILCDISMTAASLFIFLLVRKHGMKFIELFVEKERAESFRLRKTTPKSVSFLFFFFLLPGMPKDLMSYAAGLTDMPVWIWICINFVGRFPAIWMSASSGSALGSQDYGTAIAMIAVIAALYLLGMFAYRRHMR